MGRTARVGVMGGVALSVLFAGIRLAGPAPAGGAPAPEAGAYARGVPGPVTALVFSPEEGVAYAGTGWGVYRSGDGGRTWERVFRAGVWRGPVRALAADPEAGTLYAAVGEEIYRRGRGEASWSRVYAGRGGVLCAAVSPHDPALVLAGSARGLLLSRDGGDHWEKGGGGAAAGPVRQVLFDPVRRGTCYLLSGEGLHRSGDGGKSWTPLRGEREGVPEEAAEEESGSEEEAPEPSSARRLAADANGDLYLGTSSGVLLSEDAGQSWRAVPTAGIGTPSVEHLLCDPARPGFLYAVTPGGLFAYSGEWEAWRPVREGLEAGEVGSIGLDSLSGRLWVGTRKGMYRLSVREAGAAGPLFASEGVPSVAAGPSILAVQQAAIRYAEVQPQKISRWRALARWRSFFPRFTVGLDRDQDPTIVSSTTAGVTRFSVGPEKESLSFGLGFSWELADLIWNPDQTSIDVRSRLMVQLRQDVLEEVTRLYFERKRLLAEFTRHPSDDPLLDSERVLRVEEVTAQLDALTGGGFSEND